MKGIPISPKHGVNPSIDICFFCGGETGSIILNGKMRGDIEAPKYTVSSYTPCQKCQKCIDEGVGLIEVTDIQPRDGRPRIAAENKEHPDLYPTGYLAVITTKAAHEILDPNLEQGMTVLMDTLMFQDLMASDKLGGEHDDSNNRTYS